MPDLSNQHRYSLADLPKRLERTRAGIHRRRTYMKRFAELFPDRQCPQLLPLPFMEPWGDVFWTEYSIQAWEREVGHEWAAQWRMPRE